MPDEPRLVLEPGGPWCANVNPNPPDMRLLLSRRGFLRAGLTVTAAGAVTALGGIGTARAEECVDGLGSIPPEQRNIQLFTLLAAHLASPHATLQALAAIGYQNVEHIGTYVPDAATFRQAMDLAGISAPSGHTGIAHPFDRDQVMGLIEDAHVIGHQWLINPNGGGGDTEDSWKAFAETLNLAGQLAQENDLLGTGHHNHAPEYTVLDGSEFTPTQVLMDHCDPALTTQEMDLYWVWSAGVDPVEYLQAYPGRYRFFHVKDMAEDGSITLPGQGIIDFNRIFEEAARSQTIEQYIIEHDLAPTGLESAALGWQLLEDASFACPTEDAAEEPAPAPDPEPSEAPAPEPTEPVGQTSAGAPAQSELPATGGGLAAIGAAAVGAFLSLRNRTR